LSASKGSWSFTRWETIGQLESLVISHPHFSARIVRQGAHLTHFSPTGEPNWLWLSPKAKYETNRAIRGGIPLCWPWFGEPERNPPSVRESIRSSRAHGFARTALWDLESVYESASEVEVSFSLDGSNGFEDLWSGRARALLTLRFSASNFQIALTSLNLDDSPRAISQALHTYLPTNDILLTTVRGFDDSEYIDTLDNWEIRQQQGPILFPGEVDRIYTTGNEARLLTPGGARILTPSGSDSTVIWNPGPDKAALLSDFPVTGWKDMVCIETANAGPDYQVLQQGQGHTLALMVS